MSASSISFAQALKRARHVEAMVHLDGSGYRLRTSKTEVRDSGVSRALQRTRGETDGDGEYVCETDTGSVPWVLEADGTLLIG